MRWGALLTSIAVAGSPAAAQAYDSLDQDGRSPTVSLASRSKMIAHCVVNRARNSSRNLVLSTSSNKIGGGDRSSIQQAMGGCMSARDASITVDIFDLRGDLAEELLVENDAARLRQSAALTPHPAQRIAAGPGSGDMNEMIVRCAVAADPADGARLLTAGAETLAELDAFRKLLPGVQSCVPEKVELHIKPFQVRRLVAISLYRLIDGAASTVEKN